MAELNRLGREVWRSLGRLGDAELVAPGGTPYAVGDRVVTLAPGAGGKVVTSATATVIAVDATNTSVAVRMDDDRQVRILAGEEIAASRLAHSYAVTVHRSQGSTVERAHALEDGGGRELAYVKMSRAKEQSTVYVVADSIDQACEDLRREWSTDRRLAWVIDTGLAGADSIAVEASRRAARPRRDALRRGWLVAERDAILAVIPPDPTPSSAPPSCSAAASNASASSSPAARAATGTTPWPVPCGRCVRPRAPSPASSATSPPTASRARTSTAGEASSGSGGRSWRPPPGR